MVLLSFFSVLSLFLFIVVHCACDGSCTVHVCQNVWMPHYIACEYIVHTCMSVYTLYMFTLNSMCIHQCTSMCVSVKVYCLLILQCIYVCVHEPFRAPSMIHVPVHDQVYVPNYY